MTDFLASIGYDGWILHALIWGPLVGMIHVLLVEEDRAKTVAFRWSLALFLVSMGLWWAFVPGDGGFTLTSSVPWIAAWGVDAEAVPYGF